MLTAAGSAAGIDLCLHVVRGDYGPEVANAVARRLVVPPHRDGGQAQFVEAPVAMAHEAARLGPLVDWMRRHLDQPQPIEQLAARAGMSMRTFQRRFTAATGQPPGAWLLAERLRHARLLLETGTAGLEDIAAACGFGTAATLRHHFRGTLGISPTTYRRAFAGEGAARTEPCPAPNACSA